MTKTRITPTLFELPTKIKDAKPFLRWTGSKGWLIKEGIEDFIPKQYNRYHELFVGGGSLFFYLNNNGKNYLNDLNSDLMNTYIQIRDDVDKTISFLKGLINQKEEYYIIRNKQYKQKFQQAAQFIYLNRTSFNGIYRVNSSGQYNVPYGYRQNVDIVTEENLRLVSAKLQGVILTNESFENSVENIKRGDFVFLDPPYTVAHENNGFIEYNSKLFSWTDQEKLAAIINEIHKQGAYFLLCNAEHSAIRKLYKGIGQVHSMSRYSKVGGRNKTRGIFNELLITNVNE